MGVTQSIHVDLAVPPSCPTTAPWGGGSSPPSAEHPRFPFNADANGLPYDEVNGRFSTMSTYLTTCGGWQRDATYRFDATTWNTPQYVYVYAHNDKYSLVGTASTSPSGSEIPSYVAMLKHYVETEDVTDNVPSTAVSAGGEFVQRNKHGGIYTWGNLERYPFGRSDAAVVTDPARTGAMKNLHDTGFTTYGYSSYESLYGYVAMTGDGAGGSGYPDLTRPCCSNWMMTIDPATTLVDLAGDGGNAACVYEDAFTGGSACENDLMGTAQARPYTTTGAPCLPKVLADGTGAGAAGDYCIPTFAKVGMTVGNGPDPGGGAIGSAGVVQGSVTAGDQSSSSTRVETGWATALANIPK